MVQGREQKTLHGVDRVGPGASPHGGVQVRDGNPPWRSEAREERGSSMEGPV